MLERDGPRPRMAIRALRLNPARVFYGWWIVAIGTVVGAMAGGTFNQAATVYFLHLKRDLGLSSAYTSLAFSLHRAEGAVEGPIVGYLIDRFGPRVMMLVGSFMAGLGFILFGLYARDLASFLLIFVLVLSLGFNMGFGQGIMASINSWFVRKRGIALSIALAGFPIGGAIITPLIALSIHTVGWRQTAIFSGLGVWAIVMPLAFLVRRSPEGMGLLPDGDRPTSAAGADPAPVGQEARAAGRAGKASPVEADFTVRQAMRTATYWLLAVAIGLRLSISAGVSLHLVPMMVWKGMEEATAAYLVGLLAFVNFPMRLVMGWMGDRWSRQKVASLGMLLGLSAMVLMVISTGSLWEMVLFIVVLGLTDSVNPLSWALVGDFFGRRSFATLRGGVSMVTGLMSMVTPVFAGFIFDRTEGYFIALAVFIGFYAGASLIFWNLRRPVVRERG